MRGDDQGQAAVWNYVSPEARVPSGPSVATDPADGGYSPDGAVAAPYAATGGPSIAPEKLLRAMLLLQVLYTVRGERLLMEQLDYNLLFRWNLALSLVRRAGVWTIRSGITACHQEPGAAPGRQHRPGVAFFERLLAQVRQAHLLSNEHFHGGRHLIEAWAGQKSFKRKTGPAGPPPDDVGNLTVNFRGEAHSNATHTLRPIWIRGWPRRRAGTRASWPIKAMSGPTRC